MEALASGASALATGVAGVASQLLGVWEAAPGQVAVALEVAVPPLSVRGQSAARLEVRQYVAVEDCLYSGLEIGMPASRRGGGAGGGKPSWTERLLADDALLCSKVREEAGELCATLEDEEDSGRVASEMADLLYHAMVLLRRRGVSLADVDDVLRARFGVSGVEEKAARAATG